MTENTPGPQEPPRQDPQDAYWRPQEPARQDQAQQADAQDAEHSQWQPQQEATREIPQEESRTTAQSDPWVAHQQPTQEQQQVLFGSAVSGQGQPGVYVPPSSTQTYPTPPPLGQASPPRRASGLVAGVAVLALLTGGGAGALGGYLVAENNAATAPSALDVPPPAAQASTNAPDGTIEAVANKLLPSVVQLRTRSGEGSGFVIRQDGLVVTNNHVIEEAANGGTLKVVFQDGQIADASVVGRDPSSDLAVVQAKGASGKTPVVLGRSDDLKVGQAVVAIGSPFELSGTVTSGIVSSLHRPTRAGGDDGSEATVMDAIQTDAAINPGNSGGPLVNMAGQVVGINSAIYSPGSSSRQQGGSVGIGFAIPIDQARRTADEIVKTGKATQTVLGVSVQTDPNGGARVNEVTPGGAAAAAGIAAGDVVTKLNDRRIDTSDALVAAVRSLAPGDKVTLTIGNGTKTVTATLGGQPVPIN
ncbi:S1C family serine protease [Kibdelosporangium persicum]|uniref:Periplasmic serine endoprotease DegP n=1 Tax=Kibdelosporangium persicum TaxID=2698649 RepID=A0ABX2FH61_9PSEU|nr:trypsin-like peptidase domain-containing protein [Kibdelosporangium persicum]NRN70731.1 Periplasmic serine endoprotease DegP [Kibdelosporangium persicum]